MAKALTKTAQDARDEVRAAMPSEFILRRERFMLSGVTILGARKDNLSAFVYDRQSFMARQEYGGEKAPKLGGRYIAIPLAGARPSDRELVP
ncbi:MAG: hypothetical protein WCA36_12195, partial [Pseudolabrys sp.]